MYAQLGMVVHNAGAQEVEAGEKTQVQGQPGLRIRYPVKSETLPQNKQTNKHPGLLRYLSV